MKESSRTGWKGAWGFISTAALLGLLACSSDSGRSSFLPADPVEPQQPPNILFIVMDDLGVDQLSAFGYGGLGQPVETPSIDSLAQVGVRFRNTWSMPTCSPTRATFFQGRYPFRTDIKNAIVALDLANSQVSPYEMTTPKLLKQRGYVNAVIGKMHLSGSDLEPANNPLGHEVMRELGWDYFEGYLDGGPYPIDTSAGGVAPAGTYSCGFVPNTRDDPLTGADEGACYLADGSCSVLSVVDVDTPGRACLEQGGIFDPGVRACQASPPGNLDFKTQNGYYTAEWILNREDGSTDVIPVDDSRGRGYRTIMETDRAIDWIKQQPAGKPWMLSLGYSAIHTPIQPPPASLLAQGSAATGNFDCKDVMQQREISDQMLEAMDREISRLLVETDLARYTSDGSLEYRLEETNTVVILVADNGSYATTVKAPFNPARAKGFAYQSGVWVPLIIAGPPVREPGRDVTHMVNATDLFSLFAELAGVEVSAAVPGSRTVDAQAMLPYLTEPEHPAIRSSNYTESGTNIGVAGAPPAPPCVIPLGPAGDVCVQVFPQGEVCEDQGGTWYGPGGAAGATGLSSCCAVNDHLITQGENPADILPRSQRAIRDQQFKLLRMEQINCATNQLEMVDEFYEINEASGLALKLDNAPHELLARGLTPEQQVHYDSLSDELEELLDSENRCVGDGNRDGVVDNEDIDNWRHFSQHNNGRSSWYDVNHDGLTDTADLLIIEANLGCQ